MVFLDNLRHYLVEDLRNFIPELILCGGIVLLLILRLFREFSQVHLAGIALVIALGALAGSIQQWMEIISPEGAPRLIEGRRMFSGLLIYDNFSIFLRMFLFGFTALLIWLTWLTGIPDTEDSADFYCLLLGAVLGMSLMASANHLLMVFIGVEMASLPSYAMAGFLKGRRQGSEASLKYVVYGGGASGIMLYGISLIAGKFGTGFLPDVATGLVSSLQNPPPHSLVGFDPILLLGLLFILIGLAFKLAAVPFHFWCPDVFEGAAAEVAAFLSVASKGAALALLGRFALTLAGLSDLAPFRSPNLPPAWLSVARFLVPGLAFFAALTATFGNLAAYPQTNLKRLLAYSTIAHAGYMMMGLAPLSLDGAAAVLFYLVAYLFMNLGAFAIVAFIRNQTGSEDLSGYKGMIVRSPVMTIFLAIFLLSLLGLPPLAGFAAKFQIFSVLYNAGRNYGTGTDPAYPTLAYTMYALLLIGGINTAISAVYYLKVLKVMILEKPEGDETVEPRPVLVPAGSVFFGTILALMIFVIGVAWDPLARASAQGVARFKQMPNPVAPPVRPRGGRS